MAPTKAENGDDSQTSTPEYRDRLRTWLIKMIDSGTIPGLHWENEEKTIFRMPWKHAGRQDYSLEEDSRIFMAWAIHSGRYREGIDKPEPITWKTRLRCALNKMPDIREIPERSRLDISEPYRVYNLLPPVHKDTQIRRRLQRRHSNTQKVDSARPLHQTSPIYSAKDSNGQSSTGQFKLQDPRLQGRAGENALGVRQPEFNQGPQWPLRNAVPWLGTSPLLSASESHLLQGLSLNSFTTPPSFRNLVNPYSLLSSVPRRDLRQRRDYDFPLLPYQAPVLDRQPLHPFMIPGTSAIGGLPFGAKPNVAEAIFHRSRSLRNNADEKVQNHEKRNNVRPDEKDEAKCKIELLELEAAKWKRAYEEERREREAIERRHEHLKNALENVGGDLLAMINREHPEHAMNNESNSEKKSQRRSTLFHSSSMPFRRRSAGDNSHVTSGVTSRSGRYSAEEGTNKNRSIFEHKNNRGTPRSPRRRHVEDDISSQALDLSSSSPAKRSRNDCHNLCKDPSASEHTFGRCSTSSDGTATTTPKQSVPHGRNFRYSANSSRISSDCDESEIRASANVQPYVKSPSASSSCSSAEDSLLGSCLSPNVTRISPLMPIFRSPDSNSYPSYSGRVDGRIQVT